MRIRLFPKYHYFTVLILSISVVIIHFAEDEYDANIFCMASDADLNDLDPTLKGGPKILLRNLRDKLKDAKVRMHNNAIRIKF